jgi:hypothetical protein
VNGPEAARKLIQPTVEPLALQPVGDLLGAPAVADFHERNCPAT